MQWKFWRVSSVALLVILSVFLLGWMGLIEGHAYSKFRDLTSNLKTLEVEKRYLERDDFVKYGHVVPDQSEIDGIGRDIDEMALAVEKSRTYLRVSRDFTAWTSVLVFPYLLYFYVFAVSWKRNRHKKPTPVSYGAVISCLLVTVGMVELVLSSERCSGYACFTFIVVPVSFVVLGVVVIIAACLVGWLIRRVRARPKGGCLVESSLTESEKLANLKDPRFNF